MAPLRSFKCISTREFIFIRFSLKGMPLRYILCLSFLKLSNFLSKISSAKKFSAALCLSSFFESPRALIWYFTCVFNELSDLIFRLIFTTRHHELINAAASLFKFCFNMILLSNSNAFSSARLNSDDIWRVYTNWETMNMPQKQLITMMNLPMFVTG